MDNEIIERVSKAILETPNASDYESLIAKNAIKALITITDAEAKRLKTEDDCSIYTNCNMCGGHTEGLHNILKAVINEL